MGQQQLLLLVVGLIIVAVAVVVGINQFTEAAESGAVDNMIAAQQNVAGSALRYYMKPESFGGGGGTFDGTIPWTIPSGLEKVGSYTITPTVSSTQVDLVATVGTKTVTTTITGNPASVITSVM